MKIFIILSVFFSLSVFAQNNFIKGKVLDSETKSPLPGANILVDDYPGYGTASDNNGNFVLNNFPDDAKSVSISYLGYDTRTINFSDFVRLPHSVSEDGSLINIIYLNRKIIPSQSILVEASVGTKGLTPIAFDKIKKEEIQKNYSVYDVPKYLSDLPSTTFYSEGGNGIGYNYLSIRGFDQRRISVSINGIPQNDPEDHNVYWLDFPDLLASTELIQVQRGAGSGVFGYPAIGGSINLITSSFSNKPSIELNTSYGAYVTKKYSASFSSGLINNKYAVYGKLGKIKSSGYKEKTWVDFNSYFLSAIRYDENFSTQVNFYGGPVADGLGYTGVAKFAVKSKDLRKKNYSYWEADENQYTYTVERRPEEIENFSQPHYELLNEWQINDKLKFNSALFLVNGQGFFDYDGSWSVFYDDYFRLKHNGYDTSFIPTNALIRAMVENTQYGWVPRFSFNHENGTLFFGAELRKHNSVHWGAINFAENLPPGVTKEYKYYYYKGGKDIASVFVNESYNLSEQFNLLAELQFAYHNYKLYDEKYVGTEFSINNLFLNPRIGINYKPISKINVYTSFARVSREPRLKEYYDAAESSGGEVPKFKINSDGTFNFSEPLVKPETMNDFELGSSLNTENLSITLNLFYMLFNDEIVKDGQVDRFGQPTIGNVDRSIHYGAELSAIFRLFNNRLEVFGNSTFSKNKIEEGKFFIDENKFIDLSGNKITGFPDFLANFGVIYSDHGFYLKFTGKYVGRFYSDNYDDKLISYLSEFPGFVDYSDNINEAYFVSDLFAGYSFSPFITTTPWKVFIQINNVFDNLYSAYAIGKEFFPAAERNWLAGIQVGL